jgi:NADPH:quinone reductase-like Zn-dependent oxidoreductase
VIATSSKDENLTRRKALGVWEVVTNNKRRDWDKAVLELTDGMGVDQLLDVLAVTA